MQIGRQKRLCLSRELQHLEQILFAKPIGKEPASEMQIFDERRACINEAILIRQPLIQQNGTAERCGIGKLLCHAAANGIQQQGCL